MELSDMWKVYLCGDWKMDTGKEKSWQKDLEKDLKGKYDFLEPVDTALKGSGEFSLDKFLSNTDKNELFSRFLVIDGADVVVVNGSCFSMETALQLFYAGLSKKTILVFAENKMSHLEFSYISLIGDESFQSYNELVGYLREMKVLPEKQHSALRELTFSCIQKENADLFSKEDRKDPLFRAAILATELGQILHYLTHDHQINPAARPVGTRSDEEAQLGDCLVQFIMYCVSRDFKLSDVYSIGIRRMKEAVWKQTQLEVSPRELRPNEIGYGISASVGKATGRIAVLGSAEDASKISEGKCIVVITEYTKPVWDEITARIENVIGLISGTGSPNSHPAIVCRELKKPCIVSAKELVSRVKDGEIVTMQVEAESEENTVFRASI
jgi:phosphohistidine swiveling domain-containing protein